MIWRDPFMFLLLIVLLGFAWWAFRRQQTKGGPISSSSVLPLTTNIWGLVVHVPWLLRIVVMACLVVALARPQITSGERKRTSEGLDIVLAIDTSGSMRALDFTLNGERQDRLTVVKDVIGKFVGSRPDDRIGMVVFGDEAFTQAPLTLDHQVLAAFLERVQIGMAGDRTAIGDAIATSVNRVKDVDAKSRIVILLTDGRNTAGTVEPETASEAAAAVDVRLYTIGVGGKGKAPIPVNGVFGQRVVYQEVDLDEDLLKSIAERTGGKYFRAYDTDSLQKVYEAIDKLEKTKVEVQEFVQVEEVYGVWLWAALCGLVLELLWWVSPLRSIPL